MRGQQLFLEYFDNDEANAKAFTDDGWFKTGDMVHIAEGGNFVYSERDKDVLKVGGENVSAREVEDMCRQVPGIAEIAVVGQAHDFLSMVPVAFVIKGPGAEPDDKVVREGDHRRLRQEPLRLQGAAGGVLRRGVPARDAGQGREEQVAGVGRCTGGSQLKASQTGQGHT